jgi:hypothetical protein
MTYFVLVLDCLKQFFEEAVEAIGSEFGVNSQHFTGLLILVNSPSYISELTISLVPS